MEILDQAGHISNLNNKIKDFERTLDQFRVLVKSQQEQLALVRQRESESQSQASELNQQSQQLLNENMALQTKVLKSTAVAIDQQIAKLNVSQAEQQFRFIKDFLPTNIFQADYDSLSLFLLVKRLFFKAELIADQLHQWQPSDETVDKYGVEEVTYYWELRVALGHISDAARDFDYAFRRGDTALWLRLGSLLGSLQSREAQVDHFLTLLRDESLNINEPLTSLTDLAETLTELSASQLTSVAFPIHDTLQRSAEHSVVEAQRLWLGTCNVTALLNSRADATPLPALPEATVRRVIELARKLQQTLGSYEPQPTDVDDVRQQLTRSRRSLHRARQTLFLFQQRLASAIDSAQDTASLLPSEAEAKESEDSNDTEVIQQGASSEEREQVWGWLEGLLQSSWEALKEASDTMMRGSALWDAGDDTSEPYNLRAEAVQQSLNDATTLQHRLEEKDQELKEYKKIYQLKENELRDVKWKEEALDQKLRAAQTRIDKLTAQVDSAEKERAAHSDQSRAALESLQSDLTAARDALRHAEAERDAQPAPVDSSATPPAVAAQVTHMARALRRLRLERHHQRANHSARALQQLEPLGTQSKDTPPIVDHVARLRRELWERAAKTTVVELEAAEPGAVQWQAAQQQRRRVAEAVRSARDQCHRSLGTAGNGWAAWVAPAVTASVTPQPVARLAVPSGVAGGRLVVSAPQLRALNAVWAL